MILKDLRISPLRNILTGISMFVGIIAMIANIFSFMPLPYLYLICHLGWIMLFAIILWKIQKESTLINSAS